MVGSCLSLYRIVVVVMVVVLVRVGSDIVCMVHINVVVLACVMKCIVRA